MSETKQTDLEGNLTRTEPDYRHCTDCHAVFGMVYEGNWERPLLHCPNCQSVQTESVIVRLEGGVMKWRKMYP